MTAPLSKDDVADITSKTTKDAPVSDRIRKIWANTLSSIQSPRETIHVKKGVSDNDVARIKETLGRQPGEAGRISVAPEPPPPPLKDTTADLTESKQAKGGIPARLEKADPDSGDNILLGQDAFTVDKQIGQGGMGTVYSAEQASLGREIAIKTLDNETGEWTSEKAAFIREALTTGALSHPNIVPVHLFGQDEQGMAYMVMKRVKGRPWSEMLRAPETEEERRETSVTAFDLSMHLEVFQKVCDAVAFAHAQGIIHRDLKPDNVMVGDFGEVTLMDWGLAMVVSKDGPGVRIGRDERSGVAGSPAYMAPEMVMARHDLIGPATDIYLLGATLFEVLTGRPPHLGNTLFEVLKNAASGNIDKIELREGLPKDALELERVVVRCMALKPETRFKNVAELQEAVRRFQVRQGDRTESNALARQARVAQDRLAKKVKETEDPTPYYPHCSDILALTRLALKLWGFNPRAIRVQQECLALYASLALRGHDWGLADSLLRDLKLTGAGGAALAVRFEKQLREDRARWERRELVLRRTARAAALVMIFAAGLSIYLYWNWRTAAERMRDLENTVASAQMGKHRTTQNGGGTEDGEETGTQGEGNGTEPDKKVDDKKPGTEDLPEKGTKKHIERPAVVFAPRARPAWTIPLPGAASILGMGKPAPLKDLLRGPQGKFLLWDDSGRSWIWKGGKRPPPRTPLTNRGARGRVIEATWVDDRRIALVDVEGFVRVGYSADRPWNIVFRSKKPIEALSACRKGGEVSLAIAAGPELWLASTRGGKPKQAQLRAKFLDVCALPDGNLAALTVDKLVMQPFQETPRSEDVGVHLASGVLCENGTCAVGVPLDDDRSIAVRSIGEKQHVGMFRLKEGSVSDYAVSPDGLRIVVASTLGDLVLLDGPTAKRLTAGRVQDSVIHGVEISTDGKTVYSLSSSGAVNIWDVSKAGVSSDK